MNCCVNNKKLMAFLFEYTNYWTEAVRLPAENGYYKLRLLDYVLKRVCAEEHNPKTEVYDNHLMCIPSKHFSIEK